MHKTCYSGGELWKTTKDRVLLSTAKNPIKISKNPTGFSKSQKSCTFFWSDTPIEFYYQQTAKSTRAEKRI